MKKIYSNLIKPLTLLVKGGVILFFTFFIVLSLIIQPSYEKKERQDAEQELSKEEFVAQLTPYAQELSVSHGIRPSILVAQAALESNWGNSQLAQESNNYFGVKNSTGKEYETKEFTQDGWIEIRAPFKQYDSMYDSVLDYANLLKSGTSWDANLYQEVIEAPTYEEAAYALTEAGYATDPNYAEKVIEIIDAHQLDALDNF